MTQLIKKIMTCCICGETNEYDTIKRTIVLGKMDLDSRPPDMKRSSIGYEIQECPNCHYCYHNIEEKMRGLEATFLTSKEYLSLIHHYEINNMSKKFMLVGFLYEHCQQFKLAGYSYLQAAWICDDQFDVLHATKMREKALKNFHIVLKQKFNLKLATITVDLLRRIKEFEQAISQANKLLNTEDLNDLTKKILRYQILLSNQNDSNCHTLWEIK